VARCSRVTVLYEMEGVNEAEARRGVPLAAAKLSVQTHVCGGAIISKGECDVMKAKDIRGMAGEDRRKELEGLLREQFNLRMPALHRPAGQQRQAEGRPAPTSRA